MTQNHSQSQKIPIWILANKWCQTIDDDSSLLFSNNNHGKEYKMDVDSETDATTDDSPSSISGFSDSDTKTNDSNNSSQLEEFPTGMRNLISQSSDSSPRKIPSSRKDLKKFHRAVTPPRGNRSPVVLCSHKRNIRSSAAPNNYRRTASSKYEESMVSIIEYSSGSKMTAVDKLFTICQEIEGGKLPHSQRSFTKDSGTNDSGTNEPSFINTRNAASPVPTTNAINENARLLTQARRKVRTENRIPPPPLYQKRRTFTIDDEGRSDGVGMMHVLTSKAKHEGISNQCTSETSFERRNTYTINEDERSELRPDPCSKQEQSGLSRTSDAEIKGRIISSLKSNEVSTPSLESQKQRPSNNKEVPRSKKSRSKEGCSKSRRTHPNIEQTTSGSCPKASTRKTKESEDCNNGEDFCVASALKNEKSPPSAHKKVTFSVEDEGLIGCSAPRLGWHTNSPRDPPATRPSFHSSQDNTMPQRSQSLKWSNREIKRRSISRDEKNHDDTSISTITCSENAMQRSTRQEIRFNKIRRCCPRHPFVIISKKSPFSSRWEHVLDSCPLCEELQAKEIVYETSEDETCVSASVESSHKSLLNSVFNRLANRARVKKSKVAPGAPADSKQSGAMRNKKSNIEIVHRMKPGEKKKKHRETPFLCRSSSNSSDLAVAMDKTFRPVNLGKTRKAPNTKAQARTSRKSQGPKRQSGMHKSDSLAAAPSSTGRTKCSEVRPRFRRRSICSMNNRPTESVVSSLEDKARRSSKVPSRSVATNILDCKRSYDASGPNFWNSWSGSVDEYESCRNMKRDIEGERSWESKFSRSSTAPTRQSARDLVKNPITKDLYSSTFSRSWTGPVEDFKTVHRGSASARESIESDKERSDAIERDGKLQKKFRRSFTEPTRAGSDKLINDCKRKCHASNSNELWRSWSGPVEDFRTVQTSDGVAAQPIHRSSNKSRTEGRARESTESNTKRCNGKECYGNLQKFKRSSTAPSRTSAATRNCEIKRNVNIANSDSLWNSWSGPLQDFDKDPTSIELGSSLPRCFECRKEESQIEYNLPLRGSSRNGHLKHSFNDVSTARCKGNIRVKEQNRQLTCSSQVRVKHKSSSFVGRGEYDSSRTRTPRIGW